MNLARVFLESHVANVMQAVLDSPMAAPPIEQPSRSSLDARRARYGVFDFDDLFTFGDRRASQPTCLSEARPIGMACQPSADLQTTPNDTPMFLGHGLEPVKMR